jgi:hypothetical protein
MSSNSLSPVFSSFILSLVRTVAVHLGDVEDPVLGKRNEPNLVAAQQMIDILGLLQEKTQGNLTEEETKLLEQVLYELRLRFIDVKKNDKKIIVP